MALSAQFPIRVMVACLLGSSLGYAGAHPTQVDENSNCLECHADHASGDHVHSAIKRGCTSCHRVENRGDVTYVGLRREKPVLCFQCHQQTAFENPHFSYASGDCMRCHDPHVSANPRLLREKVNDLCLKCHLRVAGNVPSRYLPTIVLTDGNSLGHPYARHPVSGKPDPLTGGEMSCISCHLAHGGAKVHHLKMGSQIPEDALNQNTETKDLCSKCHQMLWGLNGVAAGKRNKKKRTN